MSIISKADTHLHTSISQALMPPQALVDYTITKTDLSVIAVTDHGTTEGALQARDYLQQNPNYDRHLEVIVGSEITSTDGHILGLFLEHDVPPNMSASETIASIHSQGGLAVAAHPFACWLKWLGMKGVGDLIRRLPFDAVETRNSCSTETCTNLLTQLVNYYGQKLSEIGGSDAYCLPMVGNTYTFFKGCTAEDFRQAILSGNTEARGSVTPPLALARFWLTSHVNRRRISQTK